MHISKEDTGELTATLKIVISPGDYQEKVNKTLKDYQRKAAMPGFRPGKVPYGVIAKMYRKGVLLDEINHLLSHELQKYIEDNQLNLIGNPLPDRERSSNLDMDHQEEFEFYFNIGMAPEIEIDNLDKMKIDYLTIKAGDKMVDEYVNDLRMRYHDHKHEEEHAHDEAHEEEHKHEAVPAEMNEEFFNRVFPGEEIKDEAAFREKVRASIESSLVKESDRFFMNSVIESLVDETPVNLPDSFMRQLLAENPEQSLSAEEVDAQLDNFKKSLKWQLIESNLIRKHNLRVDEQEMRDVVKGYFTGHVARENQDPEHEERLNKIVDSVLSNKEEASRLHGQLFDQKLMTFFKDTVKMNPKDVEYDEFVKMITQKQS